MKYVAKARCQWMGRIYRPGDTIEMEQPSTEFLNHFAKLPETATDADADTRKVAGLTRADYRRRLDSMEQRYAETATVDELAQQFVNACSYPNVGGAMEADSGLNPDADKTTESDKKPDKEPELNLGTEPEANAGAVDQVEPTSKGSVKKA